MPRRVLSANRFLRATSSIGGLRDCSLRVAQVSLQGDSTVDGHAHISFYDP